MSIVELPNEILLEIVNHIDSCLSDYCTYSVLINCEEIICINRYVDEETSIEILHANLENPFIFGMDVLKKLVLIAKTTLFNIN